LQAYIVYGTVHEKSLLLEKEDSNLFSTPKQQNPFICLTTYLNSGIIHSFDVVQLTGQLFRTLKDRNNAILQLVVDAEAKSAEDKSDS
jgi:hypothetical protein